MKYSMQLEKSLQNAPLTKDECLDILNCPADHMLELLQNAFLIRRKNFGKKVYLHMLINAKSGNCSENCAYCSQSTVSNASIDKHPMIDEETLIEGAYAAIKAKAKRYCIVTSGRSPGNNEIETINRAVRRIRKDTDIEICTSLGLLTKRKAIALKEAGINRYNHNLNSSESFYSTICSTHTYEDRIQTLKYARMAGMELCCGALFGMGESDKDVVETAFSLRDLKPDSIPVNFLNPIPGTPLEGENNLTPLKCLAILCLIRFLNPSVEIRAAGGREFNLRSIQPLALYPANSIFVSGYLTTSGQTPQEALQMIKDLGFEVELEKSVEISPDLFIDRQNAFS